MKQTTDTPFKQQRLQSWQPILTPPVVIILFLIVGIIFIPVGTELQRISDDVSSFYHHFESLNVLSRCYHVCSIFSSRCCATFGDIV